MTALRVLALADDLTGALEVGAMFEGAVVTQGEGCDAPVLVVDTESRHLGAEEAAERVRGGWLKARADLIYKKTDSALRGNIGAELGALPAGKIHYVPAYPRMGRVVRGGELLVDGVAVHRTAFGQDPLDPVKGSDIRAKLAEQGAPLERIEVYDGEKDEDVRAAARRILAGPRPWLAAGPAALAGELAALLGMGRSAVRWPEVPRCLVINGSAHPASAAQMRYAEAHGLGAEGWRAAVMEEARPGAGGAGDFRRRHGARGVARLRGSAAASAGGSGAGGASDVFSSRGAAVGAGDEGRRVWRAGSTDACVRAAKRDTDRRGGTRMIGITMGDSSGVGPEILLAAFRDGELPRDLVAYGDASALTFYNQKLAYGVPLRVICGAREYEPGPLNVIDAKLLSKEDITPGVISKESGRAAREYVVAATKAALAKEIAAIVTLPMNKEATQLSDPGFTGHTELIGALCGVEDVTIMLASEHLMVTHVSTHCSLRQAVERVTPERVQTVIRMTCEAVCRLKPGARIAVAGLNPHAGEGGSFGDEEIRVIAAGGGVGAGAGMAGGRSAAAGHGVLPGREEEAVRRGGLHVSRPGAHSAEAAGFRRRA